MTRALTVGLALLVTAGGVAARAANADVNVHIGGPPPVVVAPPAPQIVVTAPPHFVVIPGSPVYYAPDLPYNYFAYNNRHWVFRDGRWFVARTHRGPWHLVAAERVPRPVAVVPVRYYKVPPGHAKKFGHARDWDGKHRGHGRGDDHGHGKGKHRD